MNLQRRLSLPNFVVILGTAILLSVLIATYLYLQAVFREQMESTYRENSNLQRAFEYHVKSTLQFCDNSLLFIKKELEEQGYISRDIHTFFEGLAQSHIVTQMAIADADGRIIGAGLPSALSIADREYFTYHKQQKNDQLFIGKTLIGRVSGKSVIHLSRRLDKPDGSFAGIVWVSVNPFSFMAFHDGMSLKASQGLILAGVDGISLARRMGQNSSYGEDLSGIKLFEMTKISSIGNYEGANRLDGTPRFVSYRVMEDYPLVVATTIDRQEAFGWYYKQRDFIIGSVILGCLAIILGTYFSYRSARRYERLVSRHKAVIARSPEAIVITDHIGKVIEANTNFLLMTGFTAQEVMTMKVMDVLEHGNQQEIISVLNRNGQLPARVHKLRTKSNELCEVESAAVVVQQGDEPIYLFNFHNITTERKLERHIHEEVKLAGRIQSRLIPKSYTSDKIDVRVIYNPYQGVSGDFTNYVWRDDILRGYIFDVTGHGVSTALQTAQVRVLFDSLLEEPLSQEGLASLNTKVSPYLDEYHFVAAIVFEFDLQRGLLTVISGGINHFFLSAPEIPRLHKIEGTPLGILDYGEFEIQRLSLRDNGVYFFCSDGLLDLLSSQQDIIGAEYEHSVQKLMYLSESSYRLDDCTALCIFVKKEILPS